MTSVFTSLPTPSITTSSGLYSGPLGSTVTSIIRSSDPDELEALTVSVTSPSSSPSIVTTPLVSSTFAVTASASPSVSTIMKVKPVSGVKYIDASTAISSPTSTDLSIMSSVASGMGGGGGSTTGGLLPAITVTSNDSETGIPSAVAVTVTSAGPRSFGVNVSVPSDTAAVTAVPTTLTS